MSFIMEVSIVFACLSFGTLCLAMIVCLVWYGLSDDEEKPKMAPRPFWGPSNENKS